MMEVLTFDSSFMPCPSKGPNHFGQVQIIKDSPEKSNLNLTRMIRTQPKQFTPVQNNLDDPE